MIKNDVAIYKGENNTKLRFSLDDNHDIALDTNDYTYYCGMGVGYDSVYTKRELTISPPTAKEAGLVYTDEQEKIFKKLTGICSIPTKIFYTIQYILFFILLMIFRGNSSEGENNGPI